jgi:hypothetical protein
MPVDLNTGLLAMETHEACAGRLEDCNESILKVAAFVSCKNLV